MMFLLAVMYLIFCDVSDSSIDFQDYSHVSIDFCIPISAISIDFVHFHDVSLKFLVLLLLTVVHCF